MSDRDTGQERPLQEADRDLKDVREEAVCNVREVF